MPAHRDEDDLLDEAFEKGVDPANFDDDDRAFQRLAEEVFASESASDNDADADADADADELNDDDEVEDEAGDRNGEANENDDMSEEDREALEDYIPPDITTNNLIPYQDR